MILGGQYYKLNIIPGFWGQPLVVRINQYDEEFTELGFEVYNGNEKMSMSGVSASIEGKKPDGTVYVYPCTVDETEDVITVNLKDQMSVLSGDTRAGLTLTNDDGTVHTWNFFIRVEVSPIDGGEISETDIPIFSAILTEVQESEANVRQMEQAVRAMTGSPLTANTAADMTDTDKIYVYTGSESGYVYGSWYYHNGTTWTLGGNYGSAVINTDTSLSVSGMAADAEAVGDAIDAVSQDVDALEAYLPGVASDDGTYLVSQTSGVMALTPYVAPRAVPDAPAEDGVYFLKATVDNGTTVYEWVEEEPIEP